MRPFHVVISKPLNDLRCVTNVVAAQTVNDQIDFTWDAGADHNGDNSYDAQAQFSLNGSAYANVAGSPYIASDQAGSYVHAGDFTPGDTITIRVRRVHSPLPPSSWAYSNTVHAYYPAGSVDFTAVGGATWTPPFTGTMLATCWEGGTGGDPGSGLGGGDGGRGGVSASTAFAVTIAVNVAFTVGAGGDPGLTGGASKIGNGLLCQAGGGATVGDTTYDSNPGGKGVLLGAGGDGGAGANSGGAGGAGGDDDVGQSGTAPGGGGGGGSYSIPDGNAGGSGANGQVTISWDNIPT